MCFDHWGGSREGDQKMKIIIKYVKDAGDLDNERVVLKALDSLNIGSYLIADTTYEGENEVSDRLRHVFWLPDKQVSEEDLIVIYTKKGNDKTRLGKSGNKIHFFYWGLSRTVWNKEEDAVTLFSIEAFHKKGT